MRWKRRATAIVPESAPRPAEQRSSERIVPAQVLALALLVFSACRSIEPDRAPFVLSRSSVTSDGLFLTAGGEAAPDPSRVSAARVVAVDAFWLQTMLYDGVPLVTRSEISVDLLGSTPIRPGPQLGAGVRLVTGDEAVGLVSRLSSDDESDRVARIDAARAGLAPGATWTARFERIEGRTPRPDRIEIRVAREATPEDAFRVALWLGRSDGRPERGSSSAAEPTADDPLSFDPRPSPPPREELVVVAEPLRRDASPFLFLVPINGEGTTGALVAAVRLLDETPSEPGLDPGGAATDEAAPHAVDPATTRFSPAPDEIVAPEEPVALEVRRAWESLAEPTRRRSTLAWLAEAWPAPLTLDVALAAGTALVDEIVAEAASAGAASSKDGKTLAFRIEVASYRVLARRALRPRPAPEEIALLLFHAGALGRLPDLIEPVLMPSRSIAELRERFVRENLQLLDDRHPASRLRAYEWLRAQGHTPRGYDPLAPEEERQAALEQYEAEAARASPPSPETVQ